MRKILVSVIVALLSLPVSAQNFNGLLGQVFTGVTNNLVVGAGDSAECGITASVNAAIAKSISRGSYYANSGDLQNCLNQKRYQRDEMQRQALQMQQQALYRQQQLEDEKRRYLQQLAQEERRMAPKCTYQTRETIKGGVTAPKEESRECSGQRYEDFIQRMTLR